MPWKRIAIAVGVAYAALVLHALVLEVLKLDIGGWAKALVIFSVVDSASIGWTVWKIAQKKREGAEAEGSRPT
jgi:hypothetical protein